MKIKIECGEMSTRAAYRPGMMVIEADEVQLMEFNSKELLGQMDVKDVMEWLNEQGFTIHEAAA